MDPLAFKYLAAGFSVFGMVGAAMGVSNIMSAALNAMGRNPGCISQLSTYVYVGLGLAEAMGLFSLVLGLLLIF